MLWIAGYNNGRLSLAGPYTDPAQASADPNASRLDNAKYYNLATDNRAEAQRQISDILMNPGASSSRHGEGEESDGMDLGEMDDDENQMELGEIET